MGFNLSERTPLEWIHLAEILENLASDLEGICQRSGQTEFYPLKEVPILQMQYQIQCSCCMVVSDSRFILKNVH